MQPFTMQPAVPWASSLPHLLYDGSRWLLVDQGVIRDRKDVQDHDLRPEAEAHDELTRSVSEKSTDSKSTRRCMDQCDLCVYVSCREKEGLYGTVESVGNETKLV